MNVDFFNAACARRRAASVMIAAIVVVASLAAPGGKPKPEAFAPTVADLGSPNDSAERLKRLVDDIRRNPADWQSHIAAIDAYVAHAMESAAAELRVVA